MKTRKAFYPSLILSLWLMFCGVAVSFADTADDKTTLKQAKQQVADAARAIKDYSVDQRDEAVKKVKASLDELDASIERLQASIDKKWDHMNQASREKARATLAKLRKQRNQVAEWYGALKHSSAGAWDQVKQGFSDAYENLAKSWKKAVAEYKSDR